MLESMYSTVDILDRGWILGRNLDKSLKSCLPCYSQSPLHTLQLCLEISFFKLTQPLHFSYCTVYTAKEKGGKPDRNHTPYRNLQVLELSRLCSETSRKLYVHEFGFCIGIPVGDPVTATQQLFLLWAGHFLYSRPDHKLYTYCTLYIQALFSCLSCLYHENKPVHCKQL